MGSALLQTPGPGDAPVRGRARAHAGLELLTHQLDGFGLIRHLASGTRRQPSAELRLDPPP
jgi:hypothetical protein